MPESETDSNDCSPDDMDDSSPGKPKERDVLEALKVLSAAASNDPSLTDQVRKTPTAFHEMLLRQRLSTKRSTVTDFFKPI